MNTTTKQNALVIGCGIAGPVAAMALQRAGIDAVIYEAYDRPADFLGSFLNVASNGLDALRTIDAHRQVLGDGFPTPRMVMWSGTGKRLGEVANGLTLPDGTTSITIKRGLLHRALRDEAGRRGIRIEVGKRLASVDGQARGVIARFEDGSHAHGDFLIGVDGLHSRARQIVDAAAPKPRYTGLLSLGGIARNLQVAPTPDAYHMIFGKRAFFGYSARPSGEIYWFANVSRRDEPAWQAAGQCEARCHFNQAIFSSRSRVLNSGSPVTSSHLRCLARAEANASARLMRCDALNRAAMSANSRVTG